MQNYNKKRFLSIPKTLKCWGKMLTFSEYAKISLDMLRIPQGLIFAYSEKGNIDCLFF